MIWIKKCFVITNLNSSVDIEEGDSVVTSGLDGDTVANISVGAVSSVKIVQKVWSVLSM